MTRFVCVFMLLCGSLTANAQQQYEWPRVFRPAPWTQPAQQYRPAYVQPAPVRPPVAVTPPAAATVNVPDPPAKDVPPTALWEVQRRGNMVQPLGDVQATEVDDIADALAIPPDDSHKWFITVVTMENCRYCEKLKYDFINAPDLRAWVLVDDPLQSTCHYQVRRIEDTTQNDWYGGIKDQLRRGGFPAVVIQPPRNGKYGPNKTVVTILHGYDGNPKRFSDKMTAAITRYVATLRRNGQIGQNDRGFFCSGCETCGCSPCNCPARSLASRPVIGGFTQEKPEATVVGPLAPSFYTQEDISGPPPFVVPAKPTDPVQPNGPVQDWPSPQPLTLDQIKAVVPTAPAEFLLKLIESKPTDAATVLLAYQAYQQSQGVSPNSPAVQPNSPQPQSPLNVGFWTAIVSLLFGGAVGGMAMKLLSQAAVMGLNAFRSWRTASGQKPYLTNEQFRELIEFAKSMADQEKVS